MATAALSPSSFSVGGYGSDFAGAAIVGTFDIPAGCFVTAASIDENVTYSSGSTTANEEISFSPTNNAIAFPNHVTAGTFTFTGDGNNSGTLGDITAAAGGQVTFTLTTDCPSPIVLNSLTLNITYYVGIPGLPVPQTLSVPKRFTYNLTAESLTFVSVQLFFIGTEPGAAGDIGTFTVVGHHTDSVIHGTGAFNVNYTLGLNQRVDVFSALGTNMEWDMSASASVTTVIDVTYMVITRASGYLKRPAMDAMARTRDGGFNGFRKIIDRGRRWAPGQNYSPSQIWRPGMA